MSHNAITYGGHQAGVYHSSHAFEGGASLGAGGFEYWLPDSYTDSIIIFTNSDIQRWGMTYPGLVSTIHADRSQVPIGKSHLCVAENDAESFFYCGGKNSTNASYIYNYDGTTFETIAYNSAIRPGISVGGVMTTGDQSYISDCDPKYNGTVGYNRFVCTSSYFSAIRNMQVYDFKQYRKRKTINGSMSSEFLLNDYDIYEDGQIKTTDGALRKTTSNSTPHAYGQKFLAVSTQEDYVSYDVILSQTLGESYKDTKSPYIVDDYIIYGDIGVYPYLGNILKRAHGFPSYRKDSGEVILTGKTIRDGLYTNTFPGTNKTSRHLGSDFNRFLTATGVGHRDGTHWTLASITYNSVCSYGQRYFINGGYLYIDILEGGNAKILKITISSGDILELASFAV
jgi:hypothetical protein